MFHLPAWPRACLSSGKHPPHCPFRVPSPGGGTGPRRGERAPSPAQPAGRTRSHKQARVSPHTPTPTRARRASLPTFPGLGPSGRRFPQPLPYKRRAALQSPGPASWDLHAFSYKRARPYLEIKLNGLQEHGRWKFPQELLAGKGNRFILGLPDRSKHTPRPPAPPGPGGAPGPPQRAACTAPGAGSPGWPYLPGLVQALRPRPQPCIAAPLCPDRSRRRVPIFTGSPGGALAATLSASTLDSG